MTERPVAAVVGVPPPSGSVASAWLAGLTAGVALRAAAPEPLPRRTGVQEAATRPNVILVTNDDQTLDQMSALPQVRRLVGRRGVKFKRFYVTDPLCCPSRATFLTGQYAHNTGVWDNAGAPEVDTVFLPTRTNYGFISASLVREIASHGGDVSRYAPEAVCKALRVKFGR